MPDIEPTEPTASHASTASTDALADLTLALRRFAQERDWGRYHAPKNLACALSVEAAELLEPFQWMSEAQSRQLDAAQTAAVADEAADVLLYLLQLCDQLGIDLAAAARAKLARNALRFPAPPSDGRAR